VLGDLIAHGSGTNQRAWEGTRLRRGPRATRTSVRLAAILAAHMDPVRILAGSRDPEVAWPDGSSDTASDQRRFADRTSIESLPWSESEIGQDAKRKEGISSTTSRSLPAVSV
jgi:hypothetical protein